MNPTQTIIKRSLCVLALLIGINGARAQVVYPTISGSISSTVTVPVTTIPASAVNTNKLGFTVQTVHLSYGSADGASPFNNSLANINAALGPVFSGANASTPVDANGFSAGSWIDPDSSIYAENTADLSQSAFDAYGYAFLPGAINLDYNGAGDVVGDFSSPNWPKRQFPGIPATAGAATDQFACAFTAYVFLTSPGVTFGVNSDDDFQLTLWTGLNPSDSGRIQIGAFPSGGRGAADTIFRANISSNGYYALRLIYDQGTGGANCELFTVLSNGNGVLVNDTNNPLATLAYPAPDFPAKPFIASTTPAAGSTGIIPNAPGNITAVLQDAAVSTVTNSIQFFINNQLVATNGQTALLLITNTPIFSPSGISIGNIDSITLLSSNAAILPNGTLLPNANNTFKLIYKDSSGASNTNSWTFRTTGAPVTNPSGNTSVNTSAHGFIVYPYLSLSFNYANDALTVGEAMLMGNLGNNYANFSNWPAADYGAILTNGPHGQAYIWTNYINWDWSGAGAGDGNWRQAAGYPKAEFPGIIGVTAGGVVGANYADETGLTGNGSDNFVQLVEAWLFVPGPGVWNMGVNSDDGFAVFSGTTPNDTFGSFLGGFQGGRGASDTIFGFQVASAGFYPFRMVYEEGGGGANCEWFTIDASGNKQMVNDSTNLFQAYYAATNYPAYVQGVYPPINAGLNGVTLGGLGAGGQSVPFVNGPVIAQLVDGAPSKITSVKLFTNNVQAVLTSSNYVNGVTTIQVGTPTSYYFPVGSSNNATLVYTDSNSKSYTNSWSFQESNLNAGITGAANNNTVIALNGANANSSVSTNGTNFGFIVYPYQEGGVGGPGVNDANVWSEETMIGLHGVNGADVVLADGVGPQGPFYIWGPNSSINPGPAYIDWALSGDGQTFGPFQNVYGGGLLDWPKVGFPGIDGSTPTTSFSELVEAWLYLPTAGVYSSVIDSDDGFSLKSGVAPGDVFGTVISEVEVGRGNTYSPIFGFSVPTNGFYPFRLLYEQGGGGANAEWIIQGSGNGPAYVADTNFGGINAYMVADKFPIYVSSVNPVIGQGIIGQGGVNPATTVSANVVDGKPNTVASVSFLINGTNAPSTSTKNALGVTTASVTNPSLLLQGAATNTVTVIYKDSAGNTYSNAWQFVTQPIGTGILSQNNNSSVSTAQTNIGFLVYPWETVQGQPNNALGWTEAQILGLHGPNTAYPGPNADGSFTWTNYINWSVAGDGEGVGDFSVGTGYPHSRVPGWGDGLTPAVAGQGGAPANGKDNGTELVLTYLNFTAPGLYTMLVNSDDGFTVKSGQAPGDVFGTLLGSFLAGRGSADTTFAFLIPQAGFYPMRLLYENGGGGANAEWGMVTPNGTRVLINDYNQPTNTIFPYLTATNSPIYVSGVVPVPGAGANGEGSANPFSSVVAYVHDGNPNKVASVSLSVNGTTVTTTTTKANGVTTAIASPALNLGANNTATVVYTDTASHSYTNSWTFAVAGTSSNQSGTAITLDYHLGYALGSQVTGLTGFQAVSAQIAPASGGQINDSRWADQMIVGLGSKNDANVVSAGAWFANTANLADTSYILTNGWYWISNTINMDIAKGDGDFTGANGAPDQVFPAIPGTVSDAAPSFTDNFETEFKTWLVFQNAGTYTFTVSSDDGFRVTEATNHGRLTGVQVTGTGTNYMIPAIPQYPDNGGTIGAFLPVSNLITAPLVLGNPILATNLATNLLNAAQVAGKIVVLQRGGTGGSQQLAYLAAQAGALGLVEISNDPIGNPPSATLGGTNLNIPVLLISIDDGLALSNSLASGTALTASLGDDSSLVLGQFQGGRGFFDTDFRIIVPEPGVYPFRIIYYQGGGGGNMEFSQWVNGSADGVGNQALVNDTAHGAVAAFAAIKPGSTPLPVPSTPGTAGPFTSITVTGNQVTMTWTTPGRLQQASSLAVSGGAKWTDVSPAASSGTYTTTVTTGGALFYRLISP